MIIMSQDKVVRPSLLIAIVMRRDIVPTVLADALRVIAVACVLAGCNDIVTYSLAPYSDVSVVAVARKVSYHNFEVSGRTTFLHFRYVVTNHSDAPLYFKVETISLSINGQKNTSAYYDSVADIVPHWRLLKKGDTTIEAYAVFRGTVEAASVKHVEFINLGLSRSPPKESNE
jgi:hypothetical protein